MKDPANQNIHKANQTRWNAAADDWAKKAESRGLWKAAVNNPALVLNEAVRDQCAQIRNQKVCVLGSGDNEAVFAFAGMGARVTSVDISQNQLAHGAKRAAILSLDVDFVQSDVVDLHALEDASFDMVYTGGHVAVWVADLYTYYSEASRILRPGGVFIVDEYHPFRRVWQESKTELKVGYPYFDKGPFLFDYDEDVLNPQTGQYKSYEFHWQISDFVNAIIQSGCRIVQFKEYVENSEDWEVAPMEGLPGMLLIISVKE
ncbi:MAG: class I SAM-dependent methyltransferase [Bacteroidia bacterium]|nr:class I SAM-dependent methyltransferase [Bacteroidia bacterium]